MTSQICDNQENEIQDLASLHRYRTEIPNIIFEKKINPTKFAILLNHFYKRQILTAKEWKYFESKGMIEKISYSDEEILKMIQSKIPQHFENGNKTCDWCSCKTVILHSHHYPIKRCKGGVETVNICANCHCEYHHLSEVKYKFKKEYVCEVIV